MQINPYEVLGYFEEVFTDEGKFLFTRPCAEQQGRGFGYYGRRPAFFFKGQTVMVDKAHKGLQPYTFKADTHGYTCLQEICGHLKTPIGLITK